MANTNVSMETVKSTVNSLECSPSKNDSKGNYGGKPSISPTAKNSKANSGGATTSEFQMSDRGRTLPNYRRQFAQKAQQS